MVSWFVKQALLDVARDTGSKFDEPKTREDWATLMRRVGVKGIHIAERDTQRASDAEAARQVRQHLVGRGLRLGGPAAGGARLRHPREGLPPNGYHHDFGSGAAIYLAQPGAGTQGAHLDADGEGQHGFLVTHNEAISISDYFTVHEGGKAVYRPTCHYAYHPCDDAVLSLHEMAGNAWQASGDLEHPGRARDRRRRR